MSVIPDYLFITKWLDEHPTIAMLEQNEKDGSDYIPIWMIETLLNEYSNLMVTDMTDTVLPWSRYNHKYAFHEVAGFEWLSTSLELKVGNRILLCGSMIKLLDYPDNSNWIATGIAEATKAGVKVLGNKFGKSLNARTVLKNKNGTQQKTSHKMKPDAEIRKKHLQAIIAKDEVTIMKLEAAYDLNIE